jgi:hypothetical protein
MFMVYSYEFMVNELKTINDKLQTFYIFAKITK